MTELKTQIEEFFIIENEIYKFLKIDENYLVFFHTGQRNDYSPIDSTLYALLEQFQAFKNKFLFIENFEKDLLSALKLKTINKSAPSLLSMEIPGNNSQFLNADGKKAAYFDKWLQNCEVKLNMIEAQRAQYLQILTQCAGE